MAAAPIPHSCDVLTTSGEVCREKPAAAFFALTAEYPVRTSVMGENSFHHNVLRYPRAVPYGRPNLMACRHDE